MPWQPLPGDDRSDPTPLAEVVDRLVSGWGAASADTTRTVFGDWDDIVGPQLAGRTKPRTLRQGTLTIAVSDPAWATQLRFLEAELVARIAAMTGSDEVERIDVRVVPNG
jgi:predicted nucleic acid-binding Zn ribbon protein